MNKEDIINKTGLIYKNGWPIAALQVTEDCIIYVDSRKDFRLPVSKLDYMLSVIEANGTTIEFDQ